MPQCARPGCINVGEKKCATCLREHYCGGDCQELDWKSHKLICKALKKLLHQLQPYREVILLILETKEESFEKRELKGRVLEHLISYAEYQFVDRAPGNFFVEMKVLFSLYKSTVDHYYNNETLSIIVSGNLRKPHYEKMLNLLKPWSAYLDCNSVNSKDILDKDKIETITMLLSNTEGSIARVFKDRNQLNKMDYHCQRALFYARLYDGTEEDKASLLTSALSDCHDL
jgi:hypothetical protein